MQKYTEYEVKTYLHINFYPLFSTTYIKNVIKYVTKRSIYHIMYYVCIKMSNKMSKNIEYNRAIRATVLQNVANQEIDTYGRASVGVIKRLMDLLDSFTDEEMQLFVDLCEKLLPPDESADYIQEQIDMLRGK